MADSVKYIDPSKITVKFGGKHAPKDEKFINLYEKALSGKLFCNVALIKVEGIKPFSDHKPKISKEYEQSFKNKLLAKKYPQIHVYPKGNKFIMSDDYSTYNLYLRYGFKEMLCLVLGKAEGKYIHSKGKPFKFTPPKEVSVTKE